MDITTLALPQQQAQKVVGDAYLKFQLGPQMTAVFAMQHVQEAAVVPSRRLTPIPNLPASVLGLTNQRNHVIWVVDLARLLGLPSMHPTVKQHNLIIVQVGTARLGLAVHRVEGIGWLQSQEIQPPPEQIAATLVPYVQGCVLQQELILILNVESIVRSPDLCRNH